MLAKVDIKSAFCLLPVHREDRNLLGVRWYNILSIIASPFGLRLASLLFNVLADLLAWVMEICILPYPFSRQLSHNGPPHAESDNRTLTHSYLYM